MCTVMFSLSLFLLTRLMRGVTSPTQSILLFPFISTHTPHARRDGTIDFIIHYIQISTHTPHARRDAMAGTA